MYVRHASKIFLAACVQNISVLRFESCSCCRFIYLFLRSFGICCWSFFVSSFELLVRLSGSPGRMRLYSTPSSRERRSRASVSSSLFVSLATRIRSRLQQRRAEERTPACTCRACLSRKKLGEDLEQIAAAANAKELIDLFLFCHVFVRR